jgi:hypothetical protein
MSWAIVTKIIEKKSASQRKFSYMLRTHTGELVELLVVTDMDQVKEVYLRGKNYAYSFRWPEAEEFLEFLEQMLLGHELPGFTRWANIRRVKEE